MMRAARLLGALLTLCFVVWLPAPASAHASLVDSDPVPGEVLAEAPETLTLRFSESVAPAREVDLMQPGGQVLSVELLGDQTTVTAVLPPLDQRGTHVLSWRVVSLDGHTIRGSLPFSIGEPSSVVVSAGVDDERAVAQTVIGAVLVLGGLIAVGLSWSRSLLVPRSGRLARWIVVAGAGAASVAVVTRAVLVGREIDRVVVSEVVAAGLVVAGSALLALAAVRLAPVTAPAPVTASASASASRTLSPASGASERLVSAATFGGGALLLAGLAAVGHNRAAEHPWLATVATLLHAGAGAVWVGGVLALALGLRRPPPAEVAQISAEVARPAPEVARKSAEVAQISAEVAHTHASSTAHEGGLGGEQTQVRTFADRAWLALLVVTAAGVLLATTIYDSWSDLVDTDHGQILLLKVALVVGAALLGLVLRFRLGGGGRAPAGTVRVEAGLLIAVLVATGVLGEASPRPRDDAPLVVERSTSYGGVEISVRVAPARVGVNQVEVTIRDPRGAWIPLAAPATLTARLDDRQVGGELHPLGETNLITTVIADAGSWRLDLALPLSRYERPVVAVEVPIAP